MTTTPSFNPRFDPYEASLATALHACRCLASALAEYRAPEKESRTGEIKAIGDVQASTSARIEPFWLTLSGPNGCGKTYLANALGQYAQAVSPYGSMLAWYDRDKKDDNDRRPRVVWFDEVNFIKRCREGEYDLPEYLGRDWFVIIDDLGASRDKTGFAADMLFRLCNARVGKFTLFTTNLDLPQIADRIDVRITSRLIRDANKFIRIKAGDYAMRRHS